MFVEHPTEYTTISMHPTNMKLDGWEVISVAILVSKVLDLVSAKDFGIWLSIWYCSVSHLVSRKNLVSLLVSGAFFIFFNIFIYKKFGNEEKIEVLIFVCNFFNIRPIILKKISKIRTIISDFFGSKIPCPMKYNF